ncbi:MAG: LacI family DNA-binding transcriptional regulator [Pseudomonadota bacterium]
MDGRKIRNMEEFAAVSGISRPTVSKYFNDPDSVKASTRKRIEAALEDYDYRPNIFAMNQNRRLTKNIGIVVPYLADPFFAEIARNLEWRCIEAGFTPILFSSHGDTAHECDILDGLRALKPAGVLLAPLGRASDLKAVEQFCADVPTVLFDSFLEDIGEAFVGSDNDQSVALIVEYLCRTGEPPSFFEMETPANPNANRRRLAYIQSMEQLGHEPDIVRAKGEGWDFENIGLTEGASAINGKAFKSNTILCSNDRLAIGVLGAAYACGLRVGLGNGFALRVAGHDDHPFSRFTCPPLTTVSQDYEAITERSFEALFAVIESGGRNSDRLTTLFAGQLVMRASA